MSKKSESAEQHIKSVKHRTRQWRPLTKPVSGVREEDVPLL
jgi:hypothetical protein